MWIFTNKGMVSAVEHRDNPDLLMIRARSEGHLEKVFPGCEVTVTPDADYMYRTVLSKREVAAAVSKEIMDIGYPNFKGSIRNHDYHDACMDVWTSMYRYQHENCC